MRLKFIILLVFLSGPILAQEYFENPVINVWVEGGARHSFYGIGMDIQIGKLKPML